MGFLSGPIWVTRGGVPLAPIQNHHDVDCRRKNLSLRELREKYLEWVSRNIWIMSRWNQYIYGELILASRIRLQIFPPKKCFSPHDWMNGFSLFWVASVSTGKERKDAPIYPASPDRANDLDEKKWRQGPGGAVVLLSNLGAATYNTWPTPRRSFVAALPRRSGVGSEQAEEFFSRKELRYNIIIIFQDPMTPEPRPGDNRRQRIPTKFDSNERPQASRRSISRRRRQRRCRFQRPVASGSVVVGRRRHPPRE